LVRWVRTEVRRVEYQFRRGGERGREEMVVEREVREGGEVLGEVDGGREER